MAGNVEKTGWGMWRRWGGKGGKGGELSKRANKKVKKAKNYWTLDPRSAAKKPLPWEKVCAARAQRANTPPLPVCGALKEILFSRGGSTEEDLCA